jgi:hypothetical protein
MPFTMSSLPPLQPLAYNSLSAQNPRPGLWTAVGILSIIFASLGILFSISSIFSSAAFLTMSRTTTTVTTAIVSPTPAPSVTPTSPTPAQNAAPPQSSPPTTSPTPTIAPVTATATSTTTFPFQISTASSLLSITSAILNLLAAILLLIAGISVLRDSRKAIKRHWIYIFVKVPTVILTAVATSMLYSQMFSNVYNTSPGGPTTPFSPAMSSWIAITSALVGAAFSLAYPAALLFILNNRRIKTYVATL